MGKTDGDADFDTLWSLHPRKKNRLDALKAWRQTAKKRPVFEELLRAHARARAEWRGREATFIPYLASWLRAGGWEDEPDPVPEELSYDEKRARMEERGGRRW